jgi:hypothetical protein
VKRSPRFGCWIMGCCEEQRLGDAFRNIRWSARLIPLDSSQSRSASVLGHGLTG